MEVAAAEAKQQREQEQNRKRQSLVEQISSAAVDNLDGNHGHAAKRRRIDTSSTVDRHIFEIGAVTPESPAGLEFESLPLQHVVNAIIAGLQTATEQAFNEAVNV